MRTIVVILFCVVGILTTEGSPSQGQLLVTAPIGPIRGSIFTSRLGKDIYSFRGVRYAEPPTGQQRFEPPIPARDWKDVFDASEEGPDCPQPGNRTMSEDCLRLNVYTTKLPCKKSNVSRPVIVFLHPGGFYSFSAKSTLFGPQYLMDQDVVLVTINYRLGALGLLSMGDTLAPGNMGLKDQVIALRWVQRNIAVFGGDPNNVTLTGCSAGSRSVMLHMMSPMSTNLFHRAIAMSGSTIGSEVYSGVASDGQKELSRKVATLLDCPTDNTSSMLQCLRTRPMESFANTLSQLFDWRGNPILLWKPTVEPETGGERFLTAQPYDLMLQGKFKQVPFILGVTQDEFGGIAAYYEQDKRNNGTLYKELNANWTQLAPIIFYYERDTPRSNYISNELRKFYFQDKPIDTDTIEGLSHVYADGITTFSIYRAAKLFASISSQPVYFYKFTYKSRFSFRMWNATTPFGVSHQDDLQYLFFMKQLFPYFEPDAPEIPMVEVSTSMWSSFAQSGEPIPRNNDRFKGVTWSPFVPSQTNFLDINPHPTMENVFFPERMRLWERLFPLPGTKLNANR